MISWNAVLIENFGWTLLHSIWQIALVWVVLWFFLQVSAKLSAQLRYLTACAALSAALLIPAATFVYLENSGANPENRIFNFQTNYKDGERENFYAPNPILTNGETAKISLINAETATFSSSNLQNYLSKNLSGLASSLVWFYLCGAFIFTLRTIGGVRRLRILRRETAEIPSEWQIKFTKLLEKVAVSPSIKIYESALISAPVVIGWLKPIVLVPASAFAGLSPAQLEAVLIHELVHVRRHDFVVNLIQTWIEILLFYHPATWRISNTIRDLREFATDDAVIELGSGERLVYANALAQLETLRQSKPHKKSSPQLILAANGGKLMQRIARILQKETEINPRTSLWSAVVAGTLISAFVLGLFSFGGGEIVNANPKNKKMAIGFVSIPPVDRSDNAPSDSNSTAAILIEKLKAHKVPAIGFLLGAAISDGEKLLPVRAEIVRNWRDAGLEIGIGGYKHIWFHDTKFEDYVANAELNEKFAKQILGEKNLKLRYFSYPFLNTGKTIEDKNRFEKWLAERDLKSIKYTFDNSEWMYSFAYDIARKDNDAAKMRQIRGEFLEYMAKMLAHHEAYSQEMFTRDIAQTLVLTPSRLVADSADDLFGMFEKNGYEFVSMEAAQADKAYQTPESFAGVKAGISWFERWQMAQGKKLRDEPQVNPEIEKIWSDNRSKK